MFVYMHQEVVSDPQKEYPAWRPIFRVLSGKWLSHRTVGAPSFRDLCERWAARASIDSRTALNCMSPWFPPLQRTQGWGTLSRGGYPEKIKRWAIRQKGGRGVVEFLAGSNPTLAISMPELYSPVGIYSD
jgi:hypothetical protein